MFSLLGPPVLAIGIWAGFVAGAGWLAAGVWGAYDAWVAGREKSAYCSALTSNGRYTHEGCD